MKKMSNRERFLNLMEYKTVDRIPNHEVGVWAQTLKRWKAEGLDTENYFWNWFVGDPKWDMDHRE